MLIINGNLIKVHKIKYFFDLYVMLDLVYIKVLQKKINLEKLVFIIKNKTNIRYYFVIRKCIIKKTSNVINLTV